MLKSSVLHGLKDLRIDNYDLSPPGSDELQIAIKVTGICGSDLHYWQHYRNGNIIVNHPITLGHESAGVVVAVGTSVKSSFQLGDKVALEVGLPCQKCELCRTGRYNICEDMHFMSSARRMPHDNGTLKERINHPAKYCHKLPDDTSLDLGALAEPFSVALHAQKRANLRKGSSVLVFGAGTVGILVAAAAKIQGASQVVITDIDSGRVQYAEKNGFAHKGWTTTLRKPSGISEQLEVAREVSLGLERDGLPGKYDAVFECTGAESCLQAAIYTTKPGGKVMLIGMGTPIQTLPISDAALREVDLIGVFRYAGEYEQAIASLTKSGPDYPDFKKLITHRFLGFDHIVDSFETASIPKDGEGKIILKVVIDFQ